MLSRLEEMGYVNLNEDGGSFENGWYGGQNDDPTSIGKAFKAAGVTEYVFTIDSVGQFDLRFSVYVKEEDLSKAEAALNGNAGKCEDPAEVMKHGLEAASAAMREIPQQPGVVRVSNIGGDGSVAVRDLSPEEFISGDWARKNK
jgi:hypothetical protein